jgi:hypothetical protein
MRRDGHGFYRTAARLSRRNAMLAVVDADSRGSRSRKSPKNFLTTVSGSL